MNTSTYNVLPTLTIFQSKYNVLPLVKVVFMIKKSLNPAIGNLSAYFYFLLRTAFYAWGIGSFVITLKGSFPVML